MAPVGRSSRKSSELSVAELDGALSNVRPPGADKTRLPPASFPGNVCCMMRLKSLLKKSRNCLPARRGNCWAGSTSARPTAIPHPTASQVSSKRAGPQETELQRMARLRSWQHGLGTASNARRFGKAISAVNFVLDTNAVSELRKPRPNSYFGKKWHPAAAAIRSRRTNAQRTVEGSAPTAVGRSALARGQNLHHS